MKPRDRIELVEKSLKAYNTTYIYLYMPCISTVLCIYVWPHTLPVVECCANLCVNDLNKEQQRNETEKEMFLINVGIFEK